MDIIIPSHNLRAFSSSFTALSKIGNYLYLEFDPLLGLTIRTLNDAKSAFAEFHFEVGFFERCTSPPFVRESIPPKEKKVRNNSSSTPSSRQRQRQRQRQRKRLSSGRKRQRQRSQQQQHGNDTDNDDDDDDLVEKFFCRVPIRTVATILRPRKGVQSLRIKSLGSHNDNNDNDSSDEEEEEEEEKESHTMQLSFEFQVMSNGIMRIIHKVGVAEANGVVASASKDRCSEIVANPKLLLKLMEPLKQTNEVALTISERDRMVTATSFYQSDTTTAHVSRDTNNDNMLLAASSASVLKTETSIDCDEFDEFHYMNGVDDDDVGGGDDSVDIPEGVRQEVVLVFGIKETKALLQFCSQSNIDEELRAIVSFHWGGRPIMIETEGDAFHAELILATVDHKLLNSFNYKPTDKAKRNSK